MDKGQFIYQHGINVTVTRLDSTTYTTRMLYHRISRSKGAFQPNYAFSINYMRGGVFRDNDDINNGYLITVNKTGEQMFVEAWSPEVANGISQSVTTELLVVNYASITLQRFAETVDQYLNPVTSTWTTIGTYPANVDYKNGTTGYKSELLLANETLWANMQKTVPMQLGDRLVIDNVNYQVDGLDYNSSIGLVMAQLSLDKRK